MNPQDTPLNKGPSFNASDVDRSKRSASNKCKNMLRSSQYEKMKNDLQSSIEKSIVSRSIASHTNKS